MSENKFFKKPYFLTINISAYSRTTLSSSFFLESELISLSDFNSELEELSLSELLALSLSDFLNPLSCDSSFNSFESFLFDFYSYDSLRLSQAAFFLKAVLILFTYFLA